MKKVSLIFTICILVLSSCKKDDTQPNDKSSTPTPATPNSNSGTGITGWEKVSQSIPSNGFIRTICSIGNTLFVGTDMNGYKSTDGGQSWTSCTQSLITQIKNEPSGFGLDTVVTKLFTDGTALYASTQQTVQNSSMNPQVALIYKSTNNGDTWTRVFQNQPFTSPNITFIGTNIYLKNGSGIAVSPDNGNNWVVNQNLQEESNGYSSYNMVSDGTKIYFTHKGVFYSASNNGTDYQTIINNSVSAPYWLASIGSKVFALQSGVYSSNDAGNSWTSTNSPFGSIGFGDVLYSDGTNLYGCNKQNNGVIYKSTNNGTSWNQLPLITNSSGYSTFYLIKNNGYLFAFTSNGVYRIAD